MPGFSAVRRRRSRSRSDRPARGRGSGNCTDSRSPAPPPPRAAGQARRAAGCGPAGCGGSAGRRGRRTSRAGRAAAGRLVQRRQPVQEGPGLLQAGRAPDRQHAPPGIAARRPAQLIARIGAEAVQEQAAGPAQPGEIDERRRAGADQAELVMAMRVALRQDRARRLQLRLADAAQHQPPPRRHARRRHRRVHGGAQQLGLFIDKVAVDRIKNSSFFYNRLNETLRI